MEISRQEEWCGCHFFLQGIFLTQGSNPALQADTLSPEPPGRPRKIKSFIKAFFFKDKEQPSKDEEYNNCNEKVY